MGRGKANEFKKKKSIQKLTIIIYFTVFGFQYLNLLTFVLDNLIVSRALG